MTNPYESPKAPVQIARAATASDVQMVRAVAGIHIVFGLYFLTDNLVSEILTANEYRSMGYWIGSAIGTIIFLVLLFGVMRSLWRQQRATRVFVIVWDSLWFLLVASASIYRFAILAAPVDLFWLPRAAGGLFAAFAVVVLAQSKAFARKS